MIKLSQSAAAGAAECVYLSSFITIPGQIQFGSSSASTSSTLSRHPIFRDSVLLPACLPAVCVAELVKLPSRHHHFHANCIVKQFPQVLLLLFSFCCWWSNCLSTAIHSMRLRSYPSGCLSICLCLYPSSIYNPQFNSARIGQDCSRRRSIVPCSLISSAPWHKC